MQETKLPAIERMCLDEDMRNLLNKYGFKDIQSITVFTKIPCSYDEHIFKGYPTVTYNRNTKMPLF